MLNLRPYQEECLQSIYEAFQSGTKRQLIHLPTAAGKTVIFSHLIQQTKCRTLVFVNTIELLEQAKEKIQMIWPDVDIGVVNANSKEFEKHVVVSTIQSARQPENLKQLQSQGFELLIYDECHHAASESARLVLDTLGFGKETNHLLVGFTATPFRNDGRGLGEIFDIVSYEKSVKWMIEQGYLCSPKGIKIATDLDLSKVTIENGDFASKSLANLMDTDVLNDLVVNTFLEKATGRKSICFTVTIGHAHNLTERFKARGLISETISGITSNSDRESILSRFKEGKIDVLTNCMVLTEGFDCPDIDCVILARPTKSASLYQQMAGRGLRRHPNKNDCIILDFGDLNHSLCNVALLTEDVEIVERHHIDCECEIVSLAKGLPPKINQKLKKAILEFNPLGDEFFWQKDDQGYFLKGVGKITIRIMRSEQNRFDTVFINGNQSQNIAVDLSFEYAFSAGEDFVRQNRSQFVLSDMDAPWRSLPISDKQKDFFRSCGYRAGIEELSRGQAALIISSGVLNRKAARR